MSQVRHFPILVASAALVLSACSGGEPSESAITDLLRKTYESEAGAMASLIGNDAYSQRLLRSMAVKVNDVRKIGCSADGENAYRCDVEVTMSRGENSRPRTEVSRIRLVAASDGWRLSL